MYTIMPGEFDLNHLGSIFIDITELRERFPSMPDYGAIQAGFPSPATDFTDDEFDLESFLFGSFYKKVIFRVVGDSMVDAGIFEGDIAIVEKGRDAQRGDIVVAFVDGKYSIKYFEKDMAGRFFLRPANKNYRDIYPEEGLEIFGVVTSIIRKLKV